MAKVKFSITAEAKEGVAVIRIDGFISEWNNHASGFKMKLDQLIENGVADVTVYINSQGGDCFQANEIANEILRFKGVINAKLGAMCASAGTYIASVCHHVTAVKNISYMFHKPMGRLEGNADQIEAELKLLKNLQNDYAETYSTKTKLPVAKINEMWIQDYWMNAEEAKRLGFVDQIEGEATITENDVQAIKACGYKNLPAITASVESNDTIKTNIEMKNNVITVLAMKDTATELEILATLSAVVSKAAKADEYKQKLETLEAKSKEDSAELVVNAAIKDKKILATQKDFYKKNLISDFEATKTMLDAMPAATQLSAQTTGASVSTEDRSGWTYADYQDKDPLALDDLAKNNEPLFRSLFKTHYGKDC